MFVSGHNKKKPPKKDGKKTPKPGMGKNDSKVWYNAMATFFTLLLCLNYESLQCSHVRVSMRNVHNFDD